MGYQKKSEVTATPVATRSFSGTPSFPASPGLVGLGTTALGVFVRLVMFGSELDLLTCHINAMYEAFTKMGPTR